jgi:hypothetical protein
MCKCVHHDPYECLSQRHQAGLSLARLMAGCGCRCHTPAPGMLITKEQCEKNKASMARPERPSLPVQNEIRDPRIKALLQEGGE